MGLIAAGVNGMKLYDKDEVVGMDILPAEGEVFMITSDGKATVMFWQPDAAQPNYAIWRRIGGLDSSVAGKITRLAVSPDGRWLAIVAEPVR